MKLHGSAVLSQRQRRRLVVLVGSGMTIAAAAQVVGCSRQTGSKWVNRQRRGEGLEDRSSRPHRSPRRAGEQVEQAVLRARAELQAGPHVVGWATGIAASTVHAILRRHGCSRLKPRLPRGEIVRYERERPGELLHIDVKKLGRIVLPGHRVTGDRSKRAMGKAGWQYLFVAIDDATRLGFAHIYPDEGAMGFIDLARSGELVSREVGPLEARQMREAGIAEKLHVAFAEQGRLWGGLCLSRAHGALPFSDEEVALMRLIAPLVTQGLRRAAPI